MLSVYYVTTVSIDFENYNYIEKYVEIFFSNLKMFNDKF